MGNSLALALAPACTAESRAMLLFSIKQINIVYKNCKLIHIIEWLWFDMVFFQSSPESAEVHHSVSLIPFRFQAAGCDDH